jgi:microcompartment protein CcmL/EutN
MLSGAVGDRRAAVSAAAEVVREKGLLVASVVIPRPGRELFGEHL